MLKKIFLFFCLKVVVLASTPVILEHPQVMDYVQTRLPHEGTLQITEEGFLYIELPKEYVFQLIPLLDKVGETVCPPPYFENGKVGAHITVATASEMSDRKTTVPYLGQKVTFSILHLEKVDLQQSVLGAKTIYLLSVESSQITEIRKKLGLPARIQNYDFHITVGVDCPAVGSEKS